MDNVQNCDSYINIPSPQTRSSAVRSVRTPNYFCKLYPTDSRILRTGEYPVPRPLPTQNNTMETCGHAHSWIRAQCLDVWVGEDISCLALLSLCDRRTRICAAK
jgi:hypothetical protein